MAKNVFLCFAMSKSKDKIINDMRKIAVCKTDHTNLVSLLALTSSLSYLQTHENLNLFHDFIQIICRPTNFSLSYEQLTQVCYYNEKAIRLHCKKYVKIFLREYDHLQHLPLPLLIARFTEYKITPSLNNNIPTLRSLKHNDIIALITHHNDSDEAKHLSNLFCNYFFKNHIKLAI